MKKLLIIPLISYSLFANDLPEQNKKHIQELADYVNKYNKNTKGFIIDSFMQHGKDVLKNEYQIKALEKKIKSLESKVQDNANGKNFDLNFINTWLDKRFNSYVTSSEGSFYNYRLSANASVEGLSGFSKKVMQDFVDLKIKQEKRKRNNFTAHNHYSCLKRIQSNKFDDEDGVVYFAATSSALELFRSPKVNCDDIAGSAKFFPDSKSASINLGHNRVYGVDMELNKVIEECMYEFDGMKCSSFKINY